MQESGNRFRLFLVAQRTQYAKKLRSIAVIGALIAVLLYQTQWLGLRPGLAILLTNQAGLASILIWRWTRLNKDLDLSKMDLPNTDVGHTFAAVWLEGEERLIKNLALIENVCQMIGFATLGYEIWIATGSLWLAVAIGLIYPLTAYFGLVRGQHRRAIRRLRTEREALMSSKSERQHII